MADHDQQYKQLLSRFFFNFMELFFPDKYKQLDRSSFVLLDKELLADKRFAMRGVVDVAVQTKIAGNDTFVIILVEAQAQEQTNFAARLLFYFAGLVKKYNLPVLPIVLFAYDEPADKIEMSNYRLQVLGKQIVSFNYETVQLNQLDWREYCHIENPLAGALIAKMKIADEDRPAVELESNRIIILSDLSPEEREILFDFKNDYLGLSPEEQDIYETLLDALDENEKEEIRKVTSTWELKGRREGRQEGRREEAINLLLRLLNKRFGLQDPGLQARLQTLALEQLEELSEAILDVEKLEDFENLLDKNS